MRVNEARLNGVTVCGRTARWIFKGAFTVALLVCAGLSGAPAMAQTGGDGAIQPVKPILKPPSSRMFSPFSIRF